MAVVINAIAGKKYMTLILRKCKNCRTIFRARLADAKRGWALYCSKSCKAIAQEKRTGQFKQLMR